MVVTIDEPAPPARPPGSADAVAYLGHATTLIELAGTAVLTDPVLTSGVATFIRRVGTAPGLPAGTTRVVVISHGHHDHLHRPSLAHLDRDIPVIVPIGLGSLVRGWGHRDVTELAVGAAVEIGSVRVTAVPADHSGFRPPFGPRAAAVGYLVEGGGRFVYFAGDTDIHDEMADLGRRGLDVALLPVWGWGPRLGVGHLDPERAAAAVAILTPRVAIPIHWGTLWPIALRWRRIRLVDPPGRFVDAVARVAPATRVVVLAPGETHELGSAA